MADVRLRDLNPAEFNYGVNVAGFLGVGTTNPVAHLTVGDGTSHQTISIDKGASSSGTLSFLSAGSTKVYIQADANEHLRIATNNTLRMSILEDGNVGINTTSPAARLVVAGNSDSGDEACAIHIIDNDSTGGSAIPSVSFRSGTSTQIYAIQGNDTFGLQFRNASDATQITFDANGKVGIGETAPDYHLHVNSGGTGTVAQFKSTSTTAKIMFNNSGSNACFIGSQNNNLFFQTNSTNRMFISTAGNVGIGTTTPAATLELYKVNTGSSTNSTTLLSLHQHDNGDLSQQKSLISFKFTDANDNATPQVQIGAEVGENADANSTTKEGSGAFIVKTATGTGTTTASLTEKMRVSHDGKVGIGTSTPEETLHVNGNLKVTGSVDVGSSGFSVSSGFIIAFAGTAPSGWLECNGQAVSRSTYSDLFAIVGVTFGAGDGSTTFNVPDLQGRVIMGEGGNTAGRTPADLESVADAGGSQTHTLTKGEIPGHVHAILTNNAPASVVTSCNTDDGNCHTRRPRFNGIRGIKDSSGGSNSGQGSRGDLLEKNTPSDGAHNNIQPSLVVRYLIKT